MGVEGLANEVLASLLASDLGLPINEPFLVDLDDAWTDSIPDTSVRNAVRASSRVAFGSKAAGSQWKWWSSSDSLTVGRVPMALMVFAFDVFIENDDRKTQNSNCLVKGDQFRIIDHELAFRLSQKILPPRPEPWSRGYMKRHVAPGYHIFGASMRGRHDLDFDQVRYAWEGLSEAQLNGYQSQIPVEWAGANGAVKAALGHLSAVCDRLPECLAELQRALKNDK